MAETQANDLSLHMSLILSGAISLGAYEAGVVSQLAYAIARWNEERPEGPPQVVIDLISGASAGAMTGGMLAAHLMEGGDPREFVLANLESWASEATTFENQLKPLEGDRHSFLSSGRIDQIAQRLFRPASKDPRRVRQDELIYTCTVTSLDEIPFEFRAESTVPNQPFTMVGVTRRDWVTFSIAPPDEAPQVVEVAHGARRDETDHVHPADWNRLRAFAVASGAFPVAWQPQVISRYPQDYAEPWGNLDQELRLRYSDGGTLDNLPLERASDALPSLRTFNPDDERVYVIIEPDPAPEQFDPPVGDPQPPERDGATPVLSVLGSVYDALREQSFHRDLYNSQKTNSRLWARRQLFPKAIATLTRAVPPEGVAQAEADALGMLQKYLSGHGRGQKAKEAVDRYERTLLRQGPTRTCQGELPETHRHLFILNMALADHIAGLADRHIVRIERIFPPSETLQKRPLAGKKLGHFGGFLGRELMKHDFIAGLADARVWLAGLADRRSWPAPADAAAELELVPDPKAVELAKTPWSRLPAGMRERFSDQVIYRAADFIAEEQQAGFLGRKGLQAIAHLVDFFVRFSNTPEAGDE